MQGEGGERGEGEIVLVRDSEQEQNHGKSSKS